MATPVQRIWRFLRGDGSLTVAVCILALWIFLLAPLREMNDIGGLAGDLAFAAVLALGAIFVFEPKPVMCAPLLGQGDGAKHPEATRAVDLRRLVEVLRNRVQTGERYEHHVPA